MPRACLAQTFNPFDDLTRRRVVVECAPAREDAAVEHAPDDDVDAALLAQGQELFSGAVVEHRVAARNEEAVGVGLAREPCEKRRLVHADADGANGSLVPESRQRPERAGKRILVVVVGVVDEGDVDAVEPEPVEAFGKRPKCCVVREVEIRAFPARCVRTKQAADLRRHNERVALLVPEEGAEPLFGEARSSTDVLGRNPNWILQRKQNKVHFTDPLVAKVFNAWAGLAKAGYFNKDALSINYATMQQEFLDGKEAMYPMGTWAASATAVGAAKFGVGVFRLPPFSGPPVQAVFTNGGAVVNAKSAHLDAAKKLAKFWSLDPQANATLAKNDAGLIATKGFKQPSGLPSVFYKTAALYDQKSTKQHPVKNVDVMFFNNGDRASVPGMDTFYAVAAQNIILGHSVQSQLKFLDTQWNKAAKGS
jgi:Bacterial extracellular solute-binding protein